MALISSSIPNMINGVSQQPYALRLPSQAEAQSNFHSTPASGMTRRPPTEHITLLSAGNWEDAFVHMINRDANEQYIVHIADDDLTIYDLAGVPQTVNFPDGKGYLNGVRDNFSAVTVADHTFIVNSASVPAMAGNLSPVRSPEALVSIRASNYGRTYKVFIDEAVVGTFTTPDGDVATDANKIDTDYIAQQIMLDLEANLDALEWDIRRVASTLRITNILDNDFNVYTEDGSGGTGSVVVKGRLQRFTDLPKAAFKSFTVEIVGDNTSAFDNYYVRYDSPGQIKDTDGVWTETIAPGIDQEIAASTMPHILVRESNGTFTFKEASWDGRVVGDEDSAPEPSFIGQTIRDVFFYRNRLGFLSGENVILSEAGRFFNFWPKTVTTTLDNDHIDVGASHTQVAILEHAVPYDEKLLLFSEATQFILEGGAILTPPTVRIQQTTEFESDPSIPPVAVGSHVYFPVKHGSYSGLSEYSVSDQNDTNSADDAASHVPSYVPSNLRNMVGSSTLNMLLMTSTDTPNSIYVYKFFFFKADKLQSAWYRWDFPATDKIIHTAFIGTEIYLTIQRPEGVYLEVMDAAEQVKEPDSDIRYYVDRKVYEDELGLIYDAGTGLTTVYLPYPEDADLWVFARAGDLNYPEGFSFDFLRVDDTTLTVAADLTSVKLCAGRKFLSSYKFSTLTLRDDDGKGSIAVEDARLQVRSMTLSYFESGYFKASVYSDCGEVFESVFTGQGQGDPVNDPFGPPTISTGTYRFGVQRRSTAAEITIETDHFLPATLTAASWEATYRPRSRRV